MNKRRQRTEALRQYTAGRGMAEQAVNAIEQHNFNRLVRQGVIVVDKDCFNSRGGVGERVPPERL